MSCSKVKCQNDIGLSSAEGYNRYVKEKIMLLRPKEIVWSSYVQDWEDVGKPIWKENTPDWIKQALYLFQHKMHHEEFFALLEAHGVYDDEKN